MAMKKVSKQIKDKIVTDFTSAQKRILFLDYDGTLVSFQNRPEQASPDEELKDIIRQLCDTPNLTVVIISGRDKTTLEKWFGSFKLDIVAEHGFWIKKGKNGNQRFNYKTSGSRNYLKSLTDL